MKTIKFIALFIIAIFISACNIDGTSSHVYQYFNFYTFFIDKNNSISVTCRYNFDDENNTFVISQNKGNHVWYENNNSNDLPTVINASNYFITRQLNSNSSYDLLTDNDNISYSNNKVIIKNNSGNIIYEDTLPTTEDIANSTGIALANALLEYQVLKSNNSVWDRQSIIAMVGINKYYDSQQKSDVYPILYFFSLIKEDSNWKIDYIAQEKEEENTYNYFGNPFLYLYPLSTDKKAPLCHSTSNVFFSADISCFSRQDNQIKHKKLFGDIYNVEYKKVLINYLKKYKSPSPLLYFFDRNNNMHIFYNDTKHAKGKYFNYVMFTEDEPTVPKYEQKIERKK